MMPRRAVLVAVPLLACGCPEGTINDDRPVVATTVRVTAGLERRSFNGDGHEADLTPDGRYVALATSATNLAPEDADAVRDVYLADLWTGEIVLVSRADGDGVKSDAESRLPSISDDGRYVAFMSQGRNLHPHDTDARPDVFIRDLRDRTTRLVSRASGASGAKADLGAIFPRLSGDGNVVAFVSAATNLDGAPPSNLVHHVYVRDLTTHAMELVDRANGPGGAPAAYDAGEPALSRDGSVVAFASAGLDPSEPSALLRFQVYVRRRTVHATVGVSRADGPDGAWGDFSSGSPRISADGRFVAFTSGASTLDPDDATASGVDVYLRDLQTHETVLVSRATGPGGAKALENCVVDGVSADGRLVMFTTESPNLVRGDDNFAVDVFLRDVPAGTTERVSVRSFGGQAALGAFGLRLTPDGATALFWSRSRDLVDDDTEDWADFFVRRPLR